TRDAEATAGRPAPIPSFLLIRGKGIARSLLLTKEKAGMRCVVLIVLVVALFSFFYLPRIQYFISPFINSNTHSSLSVRLQLWNIGSRLIAQHPLLGVGLGQFEPAYQAELHKLFALESRGVKTTSYKLQAEYVFRDPHNFLISFWLNTGIFGLVSFLYLNWVAIRNAIRSKDAFQKSVGLALMAMLLFGLVDTIYWKNDLSALWWALTLLLLVGH
ncbi:MAG: O-antigen ligase family protein, partial [Candidatus Andersenbacteria bacterium]